MKVADNTSVTANSRRPVEHSSFQRFSVSVFSISALPKSPFSPATPISPPSGPTQWLFQRHPAESKVLTVKPSLRFFLLFAAASHLAISYAHAVNANWTGAGTDALWSKATNWSTSPVPTTGDTATFNAAAGAGGSVIDLGAGVSVGTISFVGPSFAAYTIGAGAVNSQTLTLSGSGINHGFASSGTVTTAQITINAVILVNASQQWVINTGANPWIINGNMTANAASGTVYVRNNGRNVQYKGILADGATSLLAVGGTNGAHTAILTNLNNSFTGGIFFENGTTSVASISNIGTNSAAGADGLLRFGSGLGGGTLIYTGTGDTTNRVVTISHGNFGAAFTQSGTGNLSFTADTAFTGDAIAVGSPTITLQGNTAGTGEFSGRITNHGTNGATPLRSNALINASSLILNSVDGVTTGSTVTGTGIAPGTTVTAVNAGTKTITLSAITTSAITQGASIAVSGLVNVTRVTKTGTGTWKLSGSNTHSGPTTVTGGILNVANSLALQNSPIDTTLTSAGTGTVGFRTSVTALTVGGLANSGATKNLASIFTSTSGGYGGLTALTLNPRAGGTFSYSGVIANGASGMNLIKTGAGTQILSGANSYTGTTTVSAGVLAVNGSLANTSTTVESGGTLQGSGTIGGSVTIQGGGTLASGNSIESLGVGDLSFLVASTFAYELQTDLYAGTPNVAGDLTFSTGTLDIAAGAILTLTDLATSTALAVGSKLTLISYFGGWAGDELFTYEGDTLADGGEFTLGAKQWRFDYNDTTGGPNFSANQSGATSFVTMTVIPEPSAALLGGLGLLALLRRRRD